MEVPKDTRLFRHIFRKYLYIPPANLIFYLVKNTPITADQMSVLSVIVTFIGSLFLVKGGFSNNLIGILLFNLGFVLDCVDGPIARHKGSNPVFGASVDGICDIIKSAIIAISITIQSHIYYHSNIIDIMCLIAFGAYTFRIGVQSNIDSYLLYIKKMNEDKIINEPPPAEAGEEFFRKPTLRNFYRFLFRYDTNWFVLLVTGIINLPIIYYLLYGILDIITGIFVWIKYSKIYGNLFGMPKKNDIQE